MDRICSEAEDEIRDIMRSLLRDGKDPLSDALENAQIIASRAVDRFSALRLQGRWNGRQTCLSFQVADVGRQALVDVERGNFSGYAQAMLQVMQMLQAEYWQFRRAAHIVVRSLSTEEHDVVLALQTALDVASRFPGVSSRCWPRTSQAGSSLHEQAAEHARRGLYELDHGTVEAYAQQLLAVRTCLDPTALVLTWSRDDEDVTTVGVSDISEALHLSEALQAAGVHPADPPDHLAEGVPVAVQHAVALAVVARVDPAMYTTATCGMRQDLRAANLALLEDELNCSSYKSTVMRQSLVGAPAMAVDDADHELAAIAAVVDVPEWCQCPGGHLLKKFQTPHASFCCDVCKGEMDQDATMFGCDVCNFDRCIACHHSLVIRSFVAAENSEQHGSAAWKDWESMLLAKHLLQWTGRLEFAESLPSLELDVAQDAAGVLCSLIMGTNWLGDASRSYLEGCLIGLRTSGDREAKEMLVAFCIEAELRSYLFVGLSGSLWPRVVTNEMFQACDAGATFIAKENSYLRNLITTCAHIEVQDDMDRLVGYVQTTQRALNLLRHHWWFTPFFLEEVCLPLSCWCG